jgi:hypothetical protein
MYNADIALLQRRTALFGPGSDLARRQLTKSYGSV